MHETKQDPGHLQASKIWYLVFHLLLLGVLVSPIDKLPKIAFLPVLLACCWDFDREHHVCVTVVVTYHRFRILTNDKCNVFVPLTSSTFCMSNSNLGPFYSLGEWRHTAYDLQLKPPTHTRPKKNHESETWEKREQKKTRSKIQSHSGCMYTNSEFTVPS